MTKEITRIIPSEAIDRAENARQNGMLSVAEQIASITLGIPDNPISTAELEAILKKPDERAKLACMTRIYVDVLKTQANKSLYPPNVIDYLLRSIGVINAIYQNPIFIASMNDVTKDHLGRTHYFSIETTRDQAMVTTAASVLFFPNQGKNELEMHGEKLLKNTYRNLPDGHPVKPLIALEFTLSELYRGEKINPNFLTQNFRVLRQSNEVTNPHRVAVAASWLVVAGITLQNPQVYNIGIKTFERITSSHPEWKHILDHSNQKRKNWERRAQFMRYIAPLTTKREDRESLKSEILENDKLG